MGALRRSRDGLRAHWATPHGTHLLRSGDRSGDRRGRVRVGAALDGRDAGLVAAYGFDEGSGTTVTDASGNGNTGTITNATWAATGKYGKALQFNGTNALRHGPRRGLAASVDRDDAGGVGQPLDRQRQLA